MKNKLGNKRGVTLVEVMVSIALLLLIALMAYGFFGTSGNFFKMNTDKADAQAQSRLIFQGMKIDLGVATYAEIGNAIVLDAAGEVGYYVQGNYLYRKAYAVPEEPATVAFMNLPVENLMIGFIPVTNNSMKMIIEAGDKIQFETEIYSENIHSYSTGLASGTAIVLKFNNN